MAIEVKDIVESLGWDKAPETREEFEQKLKSDFIARSTAHTDPEIQEKAASKMGSRIGSIETLFKQGAKELGIEKIEGEKAEDIIKNGMTLFHTKYEEVKNADKKTKTQQQQELEEDNKKLRAQVDSWKEQAEKERKEKEQEKEGRATFEKNMTINHQLEEAYKAVPFTDTFNKDPFMQKGFRAGVNEEVVWDLDENKKLVGRTKEGKPFTNPIGNIEKTPQQIIDEFADKAKYKANNTLNPPRQQQQQKVPVENKTEGQAHKYPKRF